MRLAEALQPAAARSVATTSWEGRQSKAGRLTAGATWNLAALAVIGQLPTSAPTLWRFAGVAA